jgi:hypothetical protein
MALVLKIVEMFIEWAHPDCGKVVFASGIAFGHHFDDALHFTRLWPARIKMVAQPFRDGARVLVRQGADGRFDFGNGAHGNKLVESTTKFKSASLFSFWDLPVPQNSGIVSVRFTAIYETPG